MNPRGWRALRAAAGTAAVAAALAATAAPAQATFGVLDTWDAQPGTAPGQLAPVYDIETDAAGDVYTIEMMGAAEFRLQKWSADGEIRATSATVGGQQWQRGFELEVGPDFADPTRTVVYVARASAGLEVRRADDLELIRTVNPQGEFGDNLDVWDVAIDHDGGDVYARLHYQNEHYIGKLRPSVGGWPDPQAEWVRPLRDVLDYPINSVVPDMLEFADGELLLLGRPAATPGATLSAYASDSAESATEVAVGATAIQRWDTDGNLLDGYAVAPSANGETQLGANVFSDFETVGDGTLLAGTNFRGGWEGYTDVAPTFRRIGAVPRAPPGFVRLVPDGDGYRELFRAAGFAADGLIENSGACRFTSTPSTATSPDGRRVYAADPAGRVHVYGEGDRLMPANCVTRGATPVATLAVPGSADRGVPVTLNATGVEGNGADVVAYEWDVDGNGTNGPDRDGFELTTTAAQTQVTFATKGPKTVRMRAVDEHGVRSEVRSAAIPVRGLPLVARLSVSATSVEIGQAVTLDASASTGDIERYRFDAGAGWRTGGAQTTVAFDSAGTKVVKVEVADDEGTQTAQATIEVRAPVQQPPVEQPPVQQPPVVTPPTVTPPVQNPPVTPSRTVPRPRGRRAPACRGARARAARGCRGAKPKTTCRMVRKGKRKVRVCKPAKSKAKARGDAKAKR